ncbi:hypothetical protein pzkkv7_150 [Klebsiella phage pzk-kv7]|nr:hypothetical protein pzkkv7_150 [Klebsiella phage pzk-kv7]
MGFGAALYVQSVKKVILDLMVKKVTILISSSVFRRLNLLNLQVTSLRIGLMPHRMVLLFGCQQQRLMGILTLSLVLGLTL